jgi:nucleoside-diphosphate-sugar epimerase
LIHVRDAVSATIRAIDGTTTGVFNVVDDEPATQGDLFRYLAALLNAPEPPRISLQDAVSTLGPQAAYYGEQLPPASNANAKSELGMKLEYPSWRTGLRQVFA